MAWGKPASGPPAADLIQKAATGQQSLIILPFRSFGDSECAALCQALRGNQTLTELRASGHTLGATGLHAIGNLLASSDCALRQLAIGDAALGGAGVGQLADALGDGTCKLHTIDLGLKGLGAEDADELGRFLRCCVRLHALELGRNVLGVPGARALSAAGVLSDSLEVLGLSACGLDGAALAAIGGGGGAFSRVLRTLDISKNEAVGASGDGALGELLASLPALTSLDVKSCALGEEAAAALARALAPHAALLRLDLSSNPGLWCGPPLAPPPAVPPAAPPPPPPPTTSALLPRTFLESALPSRAEFEASLRLGDAERGALEANAAHAHAHAPPAAGAAASATAALVQAIRAAPCLERLALGSCALKDEVAVALAGGAAGAGVSCRASRPSAALAGLTELDARSNRLGPAGAAALLRLPPPFASLSLFDNPAVGTAARDGGHHLGLALGASAASLTSLDLGACALDEAAQLGALSGALRDGGATGLKCLEMFGNGSSETMGSESEWRAALTALREVRPGLDVAWKEPDVKAQPG